MSHGDPPGGGGSGGGGAEKADPHLRRALDDAAPEKELRAIVTVKGATASGGAAEGGPRDGPGEAPAPPHPKDFPDRLGYRRAMIGHHDRIPRARTGAAKEALEKLGLTILGEGHAGLLIVQGPARSLAAALDLEAVDRMALDRDVEPRAADGEPQDD